MTDTLAFEYREVAGGRRRVRFENRDDASGHWRIEEEWTGCTWRRVGREAVEELAIVETAVGSALR